MKLFWKIYIAVLISFVAVIALISYVTSAKQLADAENRIVDKHIIIGSFISKDIERGQAEARWPFENLTKLSEHGDFLFWWIVEKNGTIHIADKASFIGTCAYGYFPQLSTITADGSVVLNRKKGCGIFIKSFGTEKSKRAFWLGFSTSEVSKIKRRIIVSSAASSAFALAALGVMLYLMISHFTRPLKNLAEGAAIIGMGELNHRVEVRAEDELGYLAHSFNKMAEHLQRTTTSIDNLNREIAERKKAEEQLEKINQELKDFAYIVSHDLKAPLRGIKTIAGWISTDYADKLDDNGKEQMNLLASRVDRMHNLIDGILQYSRVGRVEEEKVVVNLNELVTEAIDMITPPENITITIENELPTIECEQTRIMQVFQNLLSNAVKYMDKPQGQIKVGCVEEDGFWEFYVADNGPGIEEKHFEKIFQLFQTLAPRDESKSTGIGLTIIKKIVEMYGGKTWVQSKVGSGSTFFFTLPKQEMGVKDAKLEASIVG
jgi:signal transduction histidine kinase